MVKREQSEHVLAWQSSSELTELVSAQRYAESESITVCDANSARQTS